MSRALPSLTKSMRELGRDFHARGWVLGTSGNFSSVVSRRPLRLAITVSSAWKGAIGPRDVLIIDTDGRPVGRSARQPSAESHLHVAVVTSREAGAVLHTHSVWSTVLSERHAPAGGLTIRGFEMLKGLEGVRTHEHAERVPIIGNDQDMARLAQTATRALADAPDAHGFLLRGHGLYTWGEDLTQARRHVEVFEFLFETLCRLEAAPAVGGAHGDRQNS